MALFSLELDQRAHKDFRRIAHDIAPRIWKKIKTLADNPFPATSTKLVDTECSYRLRVGDYRVLYFVLNDEKRIVVTHVAHRREVYR